MGIIQTDNMVKLVAGAPIYASDHQNNFTELANGINNIDGYQIQRGSIDTRHIADGAVSGDNFADGSILSYEIEDGAITSDKILDGTITSAKIAASAPMPLWIRAGRYTSPSSVIPNGTVVEFGDTFVAPPTVVASMHGNMNNDSDELNSVGITNVTNTSFTISSSYNYEYKSINWIAIGMVYQPL